MIDRRMFLKTSALLPFFIDDMLLGTDAAESRFIPSTPKSFDFLEIKGTYEQIGCRVGKFFGKNIKTYIKRKSIGHSHLMKILDSRKGKLYSGELLDRTKRHFPHIFQELKGMADGAGIGFDPLWAMSIKSELQARDEDIPGCSTIFYKDRDRSWLFHNEDGNAAYRDIMFVIKVTPPSGVSFISMVYPGVIPGNGPNLNSEGIIQTTNYIGSDTSESGIPRYIISRAVLEARSAKEAIDIITVDPRAYPSHHNIASLADGSYYSIETVPGLSEIKEPDGLYYHTNHLIMEKTRTYPHENTAYKNASSQSRYDVIGEKVKTLNLRKPDAQDFLAILASHDYTVDPYSPCRHPKGEVEGATLGTAFFDLKKGFFRLYKGYLCEALKNGRFVDYRF
jgi:predicted choloylglycine hydrolase